MRIETLTAAALKPMSNADMTDLRARFLRLYGHYYHDPNFIEKKNPLLCTLSRKVFIEKYVLLRKEMKRRAIRIFSSKALDGEVEARLTKAAVMGIDVPELGDIVLIPDYVVLTGNFLKSPKSTEQVDLVFARAARDEGAELRVGAAIKEAVGKTSAFTYHDGTAPEQVSIPLFDLVLRAKPETVRTEVTTKKSLKKKLTDEQKADFEKESETIGENQKTAAAKKPHKFKAAKWTFPNGHPRCLICGDEERTGGICEGVKAETKAEKSEAIPPPGETKPASDDTKAESFDPVVVKLIKVDKAQQLVGGIVYEPDVVDTQGDFATAEDIEKAMYRFMEKYSTQTARIKVMHEGESHTFPIIESFQPDTDIRKGGQVVKKGSWWIMVKITHDAVWKAIDDGRLNGFSMGGRARGKEAPQPTP